MPFVTCPNCRETFHLNVLEKLEGWNKCFPKSSDNVRYLECFGCWKKLEEYDVVKILAIPELRQNCVEIGDIGTIVYVYPNDNFEVECVMSDGSTKWLAEFPRSSIKYIHLPENKLT